MLTIQGCRQLLGPEYGRLTDDEIQKVLSEARTLARLLLEDFLARRAAEVSRRNVA